ncbi:MAG: AAA family ATPase [Gammaproteobacteria bacterium]|nr:AAA family ATPase [Gammaproteobacteria bacterium]
MKKLIIFGNSGSGKSSLAKHISETEGLTHLDLDTIAWLDSSPPQRAPLDSCSNILQAFMVENNSWVVEGCYADLLNLLSPQANEIIYLNLSVELCIENAKNRPWEPHKYESKQTQDEQLSMLLEWIAQYQFRDDTFSQTSHLNFYHSFTGEKIMYTSNADFTS